MLGSRLREESVIAVVVEDRSDGVPRLAEDGAQDTYRAVAVG
jgi:hypothetical protein